MYRKQFGRLVAALRKEQFDHEMRPWTQETLGHITGLGVRIIGAIEQGQRVPSPDIVNRLADAFQLILSERHELFAAASGWSETIARPETASTQAALDLVLTLCLHSSTTTMAISSRLTPRLKT